MSNTWFQFKQFIIHQDQCAMKVTTDGCLFGAWVAERIHHELSANKRNPSVITPVLEIGTGTGLLSLMLAQKNQSVQIDAIEIDTAAAAQARLNIAASPLCRQIKIIEADAKEFLFPHQYDFILSNPPFYENELASPDLQKNTAHHSTGLRLEDLLQLTASTLQPDGQFFFMLPFKRVKDTALLCLQYKLVITHITLVKQTTQHGFFRFFAAGKKQSSSNPACTKEEIAIRNEMNTYTDEFTALLKDYYLHL